MSYPPLNAVPVTTMVLIGTFSPEININILFPLLPMKDFKPIVKNSRKIPLPLFKKGSLISARYKGVVLGNVKFLRPRFFKNSITVDFSGSTKNINVKISKSKLHMCGIKSIDMAYESAQIILAHVQLVHQLFSRLTQKHIDIAREYVETKDESLFRGEEETHDILYRLVYFASCCTDLSIYHDTLDTLSKSLGKPLLTEPLKLLEMNRVMVNFNASLGFRIKRAELAQEFNGREEFTSRYDNTVDYSVPIVHPHDLVLNKKKEHPHITFTVHRSGIITISGPNYEVIEPVYDKFMRIIEEIKPKVMLEY